MAVIAPTGLWLKCPRCAREVEARSVFAKADLTRLQPGIVTCPNCGAHFTYNLRGFRICVVGLFVSGLMCAWLAVLQYYLTAMQFNIVLGLTLSVLLVSVGALWLAGLQVVDDARR